MQSSAHLNLLILAISHMFFQVLFARDESYLVEKNVSIRSCRNDGDKTQTILYFYQR